MSNENNAMMVPDQYGQIVYNRSVFSAIARNVVEEAEKVEVAETSKLFSSAHITRIEDGKLYISIPVRIAYNANVSDVCTSLQSRIFETISYMTDYKPEGIEVQVVGFIF